MSGIISLESVCNSSPRPQCESGNRRRESAETGALMALLRELAFAAARFTPYAAPNVRFRYSRLRPAIASGPSSNLNTSTETKPS